MGCLRVMDYGLWVMGEVDGWGSCCVVPDGRWSGLASKRLRFDEIQSIVGDLRIGA